MGELNQLEITVKRGGGAPDIERWLAVGGNILRREGHSLRSIRTWRCVRQLARTIRKNLDDTRDWPQLTAAGRREQAAQDEAHLAVLRVLEREFGV